MNVTLGNDIKKRNTAAAYRLGLQCLLFFRVAGSFKRANGLRQRRDKQKERKKRG